MNGFFPVDYRDSAGDSEIVEYRVLFKAPGLVDAGGLADCVRDALRRVLYPDVVLIACVPSETEALKIEFGTNADVQRSVSRSSNKVCIALCEISKAGALCNPTFIRNPRPRLGLIEDGHSSNVYLHGLQSLFGVKNVLVEAPTGFVFVKSSQSRSRFFLRAEEALFETERVYFLAYALLERVATREAEAREPIATIFVDTMAIASLAFVVRELYSLLYGHPQPRVVSFHSYGGIDASPKPRIGTSLCLISASSSMNMHGHWLKTTRCLPSEVITLITLSSASEKKSAAFVIDRQDQPMSGGQLTGLRDLRIIGERFSPEDISAKLVLLRTAHRNQNWFNHGPDYSAAGLLSIMKAGEGRANVRPIYIDGTKLLEFKGFQNFVAKDVAQLVPVSVAAVIYQDDEPSRVLAERCAVLIKTMGARLVAPPIVNANTLNDENTTFQKDAGLLIVAAVVGRGTRLLSISRDLRDKHLGARHFLVGFQVSGLVADKERLRTNLCFSATKAEISLSSMEFLAIGNTLEASYDLEAKALENWSEWLLPEIAERRKELAQRTGLTKGAFLPTNTVAESPLRLRRDFAYWKPGYSEDFDHSAAVLSTVAAMLQQAREAKNYPSDGDRLASDLFQQVLLDPENFARYNDGLIQGALLRCASHSELDYSSNEEASRRMVDLLSRIFSSHRREQGEAALEFALAIRTKRLRLSESAMKSLREQLKKHLGGEGKYSGLLTYLLEVDTSFDGKDDRPI